MMNLVTNTILITKKAKHRHTVKKTNHQQQHLYLYIYIYYIILVFTVPSYRIVYFLDS